jgi:hypothetical protein
MASDYSRFVGEISAILRSKNILIIPDFGELDCYQAQLVVGRTV